MYLRTDACTYIRVYGCVCVETRECVSRCIRATDTKVRYCVAYTDLYHACSLALFVLCMCICDVCVHSYIHMHLYIYIFCICARVCGGSACATRRNTLRTRTSKQTQSNQFVRLIDFPSHERRCAVCVWERAACAARPEYIERQCNAPYKSNPKLSFDYQANSRDRL